MVAFVTFRIVEFFCKSTGIENRELGTAWNICNGFLILVWQTNATAILARRSSRSSLNETLAFHSCSERRRITVEMYKTFDNFLILEKLRTKNEILPTLENSTYNLLIQNIPFELKSFFVSPLSSFSNADKFSRIFH